MNPADQIKRIRELLCELESREQSYSEVLRVAFLIHGELGRMVGGMPIGKQPEPWPHESATD